MWDVIRKISGYVIGSIILVTIAILGGLAAAAIALAVLSIIGIILAAIVVTALAIGAVFVVAIPIGILFMGISALLDIDV